VTRRGQLLLLGVFVVGECLVFHRAPLIPAWTVLTILWGLVRTGGLEKLDRMVVRRWIHRRKGD
jgi:hypothetical protein